VSVLGCNCSKPKGAAVTGPNSRIVYTLTEPNGHRRSYATEAEANAAQRRLGGKVSMAR
jgi:hypothetical protein